jgi:hypothetical protein
MESYDVTFDESMPHANDIFETAGDMKMEESIFVDENLQTTIDDEDEQLLPSVS